LSNQITPIGFILKGIPIEPMYKKEYGHYPYKVVVDGSRIIINSITGEEEGDYDSFLHNNEDQTLTTIHHLIAKWCKEKYLEEPDYWFEHGCEIYRQRWEKDRTLWFAKADHCVDFVNNFYKFTKRVCGPREELEAEILQDTDVALRPNLWLNKYRYKIEFTAEYYNKKSDKAIQSKKRFASCLSRLGGRCGKKEYFSDTYRGWRTKRILYVNDKKDLGIVTLSLGNKIDVVTKAILFNDFKEK